MRLGAGCNLSVADSDPLCRSEKRSHTSSNSTHGKVNCMIVNFVPARVPKYAQNRNSRIRILEGGSVCIHKSHDGFASIAPARMMGRQYAEQCIIARQSGKPIRGCRQNESMHGKKSTFRRTTTKRVHEYHNRRAINNTTTGTDRLQVHSSHSSCW